jgi:competence protein ComGC|uniref:Type II secretion system protein GspG C-terminal domain-containing protein n=1 Tax=candidate division WOR-3 bacterium TaxID=2052148 RepID=A0A7C3N7P3_UNCW3
MAKRTIFIILILTVFLILFLPACESKKEVVETTEKVLELPDKTKVISDLSKLRNQIATFYMNNGRYPNDLGELNIDLFNPIEDFVYNKNNGNVKNKNYPQL